MSVTKHGKSRDSTLGAANLRTWPYPAARCEFRDSALLGERLPV